MRKIFTLLIVAVLFLFVGLPSAIADITTVVSATSTTCGTIDVAVKVTGFTDVGTASLKLNYDNSRLVYTGVELNSGISGAETNANAGAGVFALGYYGNTVTISDGTALFTLHFNVKASATGTTDLTWSDVAEDCEYAGLNGTPVYSGIFSDLTGITIPDRPVNNVTQGTFYCTIQAAIDAASANEVIEVSDGTYDETVDVHVAGLNIKSVNGAAVTTIKGGGGAGEELATVRFSADDITLEGFTIDNNNASNGRAVGTKSSDGASIKDNIFANTYRGVAGDWYGRPTNLTITGNTFDGGNGVGYGVVGTEGIVGLIITGNTFTNLPKKGVSFGVGVANLTLTGNSFSSNGTTERYIGNYDPSLTFDVVAVMAANTFDLAAGVDEVDGSLIQGIYPTISLAVEKAFAGTTIHVIDGVYDEQVVIDGKNLTLEGISTGTVIQPSSPAVLTETYTYPAGTLWPGTVMSAIVLVKNVATGNVVVKDIKVDGINVSSVPTGASRIAGILYGEAGGVIDNATVSDIKTTNYIDRTYGIDVSAVAGGLTVEVKNCNISDWARTGIQAMGAGLTANIHDNTLVGPGTIGPNNVPNGIFFLTGAGGNATDNTVSNCHYTTTEWGSTGIGVYDEVASGISIKDNDISDIDVGVAISLNSSGVIIESNDLDNNHNGVQFEAGANNNSVLSNTITNNSASGIDISSDAGANNIAHNNNISGNGDGLTNASSYLFDALNNWWGHATGPYNDPHNTCGLGNAVSGLVEFMPWWTTSTGVDGSGTLPIHNTSQNLYYCTIQDAIDDAATVDNDVIEVLVSDFTEPGFVRVTKSLTIKGQGKIATVVRCNVNTTTAGHGVDAAIWISGSAGKEITFQDMTLDATGKDVKYAVVLRGSGDIENVAFNEIKHSASPYLGMAVQVLDGSVNVHQCSFTEIGRIGVHYRNGVISGAVISGTYDNNEYTGKGDGDWLDYALDISGGTEVTVSNSTITNNTGVAVSDGSTSAGVMATTYFPYGLNVPNTVTITGNILTGNSTGISVGFDENDVSVVEVRNNKISGNITYGIESTGPVVDAIENWWGDTTGPYNDPKNLCGQGNAVSANVVFYKWYDSAAMDNLFTPSTPAESGGPVATSSTVECEADAVAPALPIVEDYCGTVLVPATPEISAGIVCEGNITYTYTYTDAFGQNLVWTFTYTIEHTIAPVVPADDGSTVECLIDATEPVIQQLDQQQTQIKNGDPNWDKHTAIGQSFICGTSGYLTTIDLLIGSVTATHNFTLKIYEGHGIEGQLLYSEPNSLSATGWQSLNLGNGAAPYLTAGNTYTFWLTSFTYNTLGVFCMYPDVYSDGIAMDGCEVAGGVTVGGVHYDSYVWKDWSNYDLVFKTYMSDAPEATPVVTDVCGNNITPVKGTTVDVPSPLTCAGTRTYNYTYTDCAGLESLTWQYVYTIQHSTPPAEVGGPVATSANIECASDAVDPDDFPVVKDVCGNVLTAGTPVKHLSFTTTFDEAVTLADTEADDVWYKDRFAPAGFVSQEDFDGDNRLKHSILAADQQPGDHQNTQGRAFLLGDATTYMEVKLYIPASWENTDRRLAGFWGEDANAAGDRTTGWPIVEFTSDGNNPRFHVWEGNDGWVDLGLPEGFSYDSWVTLKIRQLPSGEFLLSAGSLNYVTKFNASNGSVRLRSVILQGYNFVASDYDIYWDDLTWNDTYEEICEGDVAYTYMYEDCAGLPYAWTYTYNVKDVTPPTITCPANINVNMNTGCTATGVVLSDPTVDDICTAEGDLTVTNNTPTVFNEGPTIVTWTVTDCAGNESTCQQTVTVVRNTLSGTVMYNNGDQSPMKEVTLELTGGALISAKTFPVIDGTYSFTGLCADTYTIEVVGNTNEVGGVNSTDAGAVNYWASAGGLIEYVKFLAGDVTNDLYLNSTDAMKIQRYFVFAEPFTRAPWSYWSKGVTISPTSTNHPTAITVIVSGDDVADFDIYAMCTGDFNGSLTADRLKSVNMELSLITESNLQKAKNQEFELPLRATSTMEVGAVSMILSIPTNLIEVQGVKINGSNIDATWSVKGDELRIGWNSVTPVYVYENESLVTLNLKTKDEFTFGKSLDINLIHNSLNELADANFNVINGATLKAAKIGNGVVGVNEELDSNELTFSNYPNPFANHTTLQYSIPEEGKVSINIYNQLGQLVNSLVEGNRLAGQHSIPNCGNGLQPGIYIAKLRLTNQNLDIEGIIKLNVVK